MGTASYVPIPLNVKVVLVGDRLLHLTQVITDFMGRLSKSAPARASL